MKKNNILAIAAIALTFTACSNDNDFTTNNEGKDTPISLSVGVGELSVVTRAESNTTTPLTTGALGLYITKNGDKNIIDKYLCNNAQFTYNNGWSCGTTYYWAADNATIDYVAYHPYQSSISGNFISWDVTNQSSGNLDLLYQNASNVANTVSHSIDITLGHVCSKLVVNVSKLGSEIAEGKTISSIKIGGLKAKGNFYLFADSNNGHGAGSWDPDVNPADIGMKSITANAGMNSTYEAILIPQTAAFTLTISLSNNSEYQLAVPSHTFEAGTCYTLTIQVGQDKVNLGSITQTDWVTKDGGPLTAQ
ncbi:MAG: fimbrillin family protein [Prevotella sp.]